MGKYILTRCFEIDYGHRLLNHEGKCRNVHGHRAKIEVSLTSDYLDSVGRVIDFGVVKTVLGEFLDREWDHGFFAEAGDPLIEVLAAEKSKLTVLDEPPTAENLARRFYYIAAQLLGQDVVLKRTPLELYDVVWWETPNCKATYRQRQT